MDGFLKKETQLWRKSDATQRRATGKRKNEEGVNSNIRGEPERWKAKTRYSGS